MPEAAAPASVAAARRLAPGSVARVGGRLVHAEGARALLADDTGGLTLRLAEGARAPIGAWVEAEGTFDGEALDAARVEVRTVPRRPFPAPDGEWARMHREGGRVLNHLRTRARVSRAIRAFFDERGFLEVETPAAVPSPGLDLHLSAPGVTGLADEPRWLATSPEYQMKRLLAGGLRRIYQLGRVYRRDERGPLHEPEFTMLEWYRAFAGSDAIADDTERLVASVARAVTGGTALPGREVDVTPPWERVRLAELFERRTGEPLERVLPDEERFFRLWVDRVEPGLGRPRPVLVTHWPASMASLARLHPLDPRWADRVEAYVDGVELSNGFGELVDPVEQRARLERDREARAAAGREAYPVDERFLAALEEGLPPSAGNALGVDRLVMLVGGAAHIEDVLAFPQSRL
ncbi:MAG TPA: EF-P lysine aminoacylase EpmA [Sandaracinaceae bacterium LLY-WYZ-13_1]|nr:EF-P lysine aminoacylase EpmA [Sandaracinaceae bacterium LLY-WYZ-13_1]